jgi:transposase
MEATMTVAITRSDLSADELREAAAGSQDAKAARRMLAIALVLEGWSREAAAKAAAMDRQTLRNWVHRYNADGLEGLLNQPRRNGPLPRLSTEQLAKIAEWVEQGPDFEQHGVVRWRCVDLRQRIRKEFTVELHESTVGKLLHKLAFRHMSVRPQHPQSKPDEQAVFSASFLLL